MAVSIPDSCQRACTWFFECHVKFSDGRNFSDILAAREQISGQNYDFKWTLSFLGHCGDLPILGLGFQIEEFIHSPQNIRQNSLKLSFPEGQVKAFVRVDEVAFEHIPPVRNRFYIYHPKNLHVSSSNHAGIFHQKWKNLCELHWFDRVRNQMAAGERCSNRAGFAALL